MLVVSLLVLVSSASGGGGDDPPLPPPPPAATAPARVPATELASLAREEDEVVRLVGDVELRASDVYRVLGLAAPALAGDVLREMTLTTLAQLEALREGLDVPAAELERQIEAAISEQRARFALEVDARGSLEDFLLARHGLQPDEYQAEVRRMVLASMLLERAARLHTWRRERDELQLIVVESEELARELSAKLAEGASFAALAKQHSIHPGAARGGFMPPLPTGLAVPVAEGRQELDPGEILGPAPISLDGKDCWRLLRLVERLPARDAPWSELRDLLEPDLLERPLHPDEMAIFEADMLDRYRVRNPGPPS